VGRDWGLDPDKLLWIYPTIVRPKMSYALLVWAHEINETHMHQMNQLQRKILLGISNAMRSTLTTAMETIMGLPPLDLFMLGEALKARARTKPKLRDTGDGIAQYQKKTRKAGHRRVLDDILNDTLGRGDLEEMPNGYSNVV